MSRINTAPDLFEGESVFIKARVQNPDTLNNLLKAEIDEIRLVVYDMNDATPDEPVWQDTIDKDDHWFDALQSSGWTGQGGFNFKDTIPGQHFIVEGGHRYRARHEVTLKDGGALIVIAETTVQVRERW